jgi:hypothetical protein
MLAGSSRFEADEREFAAIFWRHGSGSEDGKASRKAFAKGFAKILAEAFAGSDVANGREHEGSAGRRRLFWKASLKSAKPERRAFPTTPVEKSPAYPRAACAQENRISEAVISLPTGITDLAAR